MSLNKVVMIGRLTRDPEMKFTPQGVAVAQCGIAVDRITKDENGQHETDFFDIVMWRRSAEFANQYLSKGRLVSIEGRLQTRSWVAQDGTKRKSYEIVVENINALDKKRDDSGDYEGAKPQEPRRPAAPRAKTPEEIDEEDDPFCDE